jgi:hypothetical protein
VPVRLLHCGHLCELLCSYTFLARVWRTQAIALISWALDLRLCCWFAPLPVQDQLLASLAATGDAGHLGVAAETAAVRRWLAADETGGRSETVSLALKMEPWHWRSSPLLWCADSQSHTSTIMAMIVLQYLLVLVAGTMAMALRPDGARCHDAAAPACHNAVLSGDGAQACISRAAYQPSAQRRRAALPPMRQPPLPVSWGTHQRGCSVA